MEYTNCGTETLESQTGLVRRCALPAMLLLTALAIALSVICLSVGYTIVFQNIFYIPIILACFVYLRRGILYTTFVSAIYFILILVIPNDPSLIYPAVIRVIFFEIVGGFTAVISEQKNQAEQRLEEHKKAISETILTETRFLNEELNQCLDRENASNEAKVIADHIIDAIPAAIVAWTTEGKIIRTNAKFLALYKKNGIEPGESSIDDIDAGMRQHRPAALRMGAADISWTWTNLILAKSSKSGILAMGIPTQEGTQHE
jgi:PAS domain-containing protein